MSLLAAMVQASRKVAAPIARDYASGNRPFTVELRRPGMTGRPVYNRETGVFTNPVDPLIYRGPARIHLSSPDAVVETGEEQTSFISTMISIDNFTAATAADLALSPQVDDVLIVVVDTASIEAHLEGRYFEVTGVERGGHFGIGWRLNVLGSTPSRHSG